MKRKIVATIEIDIPDGVKNHQATAMAARYEKLLKQNVEFILEHQSRFTLSGTKLVKFADYSVACEGFPSPLSLVKVPEQLERHKPANSMNQSGQSAMRH